MMFSRVVTDCSYGRNNCRDNGVKFIDIICKGSMLKNSWKLYQGMFIPPNPIEVLGSFGLITSCSKRMQ